MPKSGPIGNQDNNRRGRDIPKGEGRPSKPGTKPSGTEKHRQEVEVDPNDVDGFNPSKHKR